ncbi:MAG: peptidoglycan recognition family protein, partial [Pseudomonadota bacterium]
PCLISAGRMGDAGADAGGLPAGTIPSIEDEDLPGWINKKPVMFDAERIKLLKEYASTHYGIDDLSIVPKMVVIHWTGGTSLKGAFNTFNKSKLSGRPFLQKYGKANVAAHYLVDKDGTVHKLMPDTLMGRHVIGLNHCSIGVENIGKKELTKKQLESNVKLIEHLASKYDSIKYLIGHYEYRGFEGSPLFIEKFPDYRTKKSDPGKDFMKLLRKKLRQNDVNLLSEPEQ